MRDHIHQNEPADDDVDREVKIEAVPDWEVIDEGQHVDDVEVEQSAGEVLRFEEEDGDADCKNEPRVDLEVELLVFVYGAIFFEEENEDVYNAEDSQRDVFIEEVEKWKKFQFFNFMIKHYDQT